MTRRLLLLIILLSMILTSGSESIHAQESLQPVFVAIGGDYSQVKEIFLKTVLERTSAETIKILVLPISYATSAETIDPSERSQNLSDAEKRRAQILQECQSIVPTGRSCQIDLAPVFTRTDAEKIPAPNYFPQDLAGVFILGGDQTVAMQAIAGTVLEEALQAAYERGVVIGGTSAGAAVQSYAMLGGYREGFSEADALAFGAVDLWETDLRRGLSFGTRSAILDQHFYQRGRFARLLNAISVSTGPHLGIGVDANTAALIENEKARAAGYTSIAVLDAETYHTAGGAQYFGERHLLSLRNALLHLIPPGDNDYDLRARQVSNQKPPQRIDRSLDALALSAGAGRIYLASDILAQQADGSVITEFLNESGGANAHILIVATGYGTRNEAQRDAQRYSTALGITTNTKVLLSGDAPMDQIPAGATGILIVGRDASRMDSTQLRGVQAAWRSGLPILADQAGASLVGAYYAALAPTPEDETAAEAFTQAAFLQGKVEIRPGLGLIQAGIEPSLLINNRWGRLIALGYAHPMKLSIGLSEGATLVISQDAPQVRGEKGIIILDLSHANLFLGSNQALGFANGLLDVYAPGEIVRPTQADQAFTPVHAATPVIQLSLPNATPTSKPGATAQAELSPTLEMPPTSTPAPTPIPAPTKNISFINDEEIPPPTDARLLHAMIGLGILAVLVIVAALWINRQRTIPR